MESQPSSPVLGAAGPVCPLAAVPGDADARGCLAGGRCRAGSRQAQEAALCLLSLPTPHPRHLCSRQPLSPEQWPSPRSSFMLPTHPRAPRAGRRQPARSRGWPGAWPRIHPLPQAPGTWSALPGGAGPTAFRRVGADPGSRLAAAPAPTRPPETPAAARTVSSPAPPEPPRLLTGGRAPCRALTPHSGSAPGL